MRNSSRYGTSATVRAQPGKNGRQSRRSVVEPRKKNDNRDFRMKARTPKRGSM